MKTEHYLLLGISSIFLGMFVIFVGLALTTLNGYFEQGIAVIILSVVLLFLGLFAILYPRRKTSKISKHADSNSN